MYISVSTRDCGAAIGAALKETEGKLAEQREQLREASFKALHDGAVHNGMKPSPLDIEQMNRMVESDLEHMMPKHPLNETIEILKNMQHMIDFNSDQFITIDDQDFFLLKNHLLKREVEQPTEADVKKVVASHYLT